MTTLTTRLESPNLSVCYLFEITAGERLTFWTASGGGLTNTYYASTLAAASRTVEDVKENGTSLTERASTALVDANAGSWYWDRANSRVYVHCTASASPYAKTLQAMLKFGFTDRVGRIYNDVFYEPRISGLPTLSNRIEEKFGQPTQIGGGKVVFDNRDGFFDEYSCLDWNAGECIILMGADTIYWTKSKAAYADFDTIGTYRISNWSKKDDQFTLQLEERKGVLKKKIPTDTWSTDTWPNLHDEAKGNPIPIAYGYVYGVKPTCVDVSTLKFRVAGHPVYDITGVRVKDPDTDAWEEKAFASVDEANAEFTLTPGDWTTDLEIACDFVGKLTSGNEVMENPADVVEDLIFVEGGEASAYKNSASFSASQALFTKGDDRFGNPQTYRGISLYIDKEMEISKAIERICKAVGAALYCDEFGDYNFVAWDPQPGDDATLFDGDREIQLFREDVETTEVISRAKVEYMVYKIPEQKLARISDRPSSQYYQQSPIEVLEVYEDTPVWREDDGEYISQRNARMYGEPRRNYRTRVNWRGWTLRPGDYVRIVYDRHSVNGVFEVIEVNRSLASKMWVDLVLSDVRSFRDEPGWWANDSETFPGSLGGAAADTWSNAWSDAKKAWARQNLGYWSNDNGLADATDADSMNTAVWI